MSYIFYGWWDYRFVMLLFASTVVDYYCGERILEYQKKGEKGKKYLIISILFNLGVLFFFKYFDFFLSSVTSGLTQLGLSPDITLLGIILPIGISFYTFQSLSYSIDIYRKDAKPAESFLQFSAYVPMFPQLVAGPIVRYSIMDNQLRETANRGIDGNTFRQGCCFFVVGLTKKMLIADTLAPVAVAIFDNPDQVYFGGAWIATLTYTLQLYFDFSGYSDMAIGLGLMLGFRYPINFLSPYKSKNISEFWRRWHMSLSGFLRDYLFIPLGGSRGSSLFTARNLFITMFLGGLWHGAAWTFVLWGCFHGVLLSIHAIWKKFEIKMPAMLAVAITFISVSIGWVIFRATDLEKAKDIILAMFGANGLSPTWEKSYPTRLGEIPYFFAEHGGLDHFALMLLGLIIVFFAPSSSEIRYGKGWLAAGVSGILLGIMILHLASETTFLYFQF